MSDASTPPRAGGRDLETAAADPAQPRRAGGDGFDVVVLGEVLVELAGEHPLGEASTLRLGFAGDALNAAAAAAAAGARVALLSVVGDDEIGDALMASAARHGVDLSLVRRTTRANGAYFVATAATGTKEFVYNRQHSAGSTLGPADVERVASTLANSTSLLVSGITGALSPSSRAALLAAIALMSAKGALVVYDPNYRARLSDPSSARSLLAEVAPHARLATPSCPDESLALFDTADPEEAADACMALGARAALVTSGPDKALLREGEQRRWLGSPPNEDVVDATGAGDVLAGTATARLALGDPLVDAVALGLAAASLSVSGVGGTGHLATLDESRAHLDAHRALVTGAANAGSADAPSRRAR